MPSILSRPIRIGRMELKNRMVMAPMGVTVGNLTPASVAYFAARAEGGAAMVFCNIRASLAFESGEHSIYLNDETKPLFRALAERCHACGCKLAAQIQPGDGRIGGPSVRYKVPISASACPWMHVPRMRCHALTIDEIHELEEDFRRSVQIALRSGADCVGIHAYGGYLTDQFLTRRWNSRTDAYGGSLENRARFLTELIAICKEEGGADFPVIVKFTPDHYMDGEGYRAIDEGIELAKLIVAAGADALHVDAGCHENWPNAMPPAGMQQMTLQSRSAKIIRSVVDVPVMTHGRFGDVDKAEAALRDGVCDIAVIGRGLLADPDLPNKVLAGRPPEKDPRRRRRPCRLHGGALCQTGRPFGRDLGGGRPHRWQRSVRLQAVFQARHAPHDPLLRARAARARYPRALLHHGDAGARRGLCARPHPLGGRRPAHRAEGHPGARLPEGVPCDRGPVRLL